MAITKDGILFRGKKIDDLSVEELREALMQAVNMVDDWQRVYKSGFSGTPWFMAGGVRPVMAWDGVSRYDFNLNATEILAGVKILVHFPFTLSAPQVDVFMDIQKRGFLVIGSYETWDEFLEVHKEYL